ncbi:unnamed protein product [marine sediment metagenome]|uniref:Uncharacterized protein n=1 Tax=marine sediment metagenome TaxID=412755 RepID=X0VFB2_9ZZZZ
MKRNQAGQHFNFQMNLLANGFNATGLSAIDITIEKDGGGENTGMGGVAETANGGYKYLWTQNETDAYHLVLAVMHPSVGTQRFNIYTDDGSVSTELAKVIKSGERSQYVQDAVNSNEDVEATVTRV